MTFKQYITESVVSDFHAEVAHHINNGMIPNPVYQELKRKIDRHIERKGQELFDKHAAGTGDKWYKIGHGADELSYALHPYGLHEFGSLRKKLDNAKAIKHEQMWKDADEFDKEIRPLYDKMKHLKTLIVKADKLRAAAKERKEIEHKQKFGDPKTLTNALTKHLEEFKDRAHELAGSHYDYLVGHLKKHGGDINKAAPRGSVMHDSNDEYRRKNNWHNLLHSLSEPTKKGYGNEHIRKGTKSKKAEYQEQAKKNAHAEYMSWVHKMVEKVGKPVAKAKMTGDPWTGSRLQVHAVDGEEQHWNTKMIINYSKYNKAFNQFPSRRIKGK